MGEIYRHTDEDGYRVEVHSRPDGELIALASKLGRRGVVAVDFAEQDGRRLLAALQRYYATTEGASDAR